ncbi:transposase [Desulfobulbus sp. F4]|nr:transposase [Desulfobulbus sp. F4]
MVNGAILDNFLRAAEQAFRSFWQESVFIGRQQSLAKISRGGTSLPPCVLAVVVARCHHSAEQFAAYLGLVPVERQSDSKSKMSALCAAMRKLVHLRFGVLNTPPLRAKLCVVLSLPGGLSS